jgi:hypothetical protein
MEFGSVTLKINNQHTGDLNQDFQELKGSSAALVSLEITQNNCD